MPSIGLSLFTIRLSEKLSDQYAVLDSLTAGRDFLSILLEYLEFRREGITDPTPENTTLQASTFDTNGRKLHGIIQKGDFGIETNIYNLETRALSYHREVNDVEFMPYYFLLYVPNNSRNCYLALQKTGVSGIKTNFEKDFKEYYRDNYDDYWVKFNPLIPRDLIEQLLGRGRVTKLRLIQNQVRSDIADNYLDEIRRDRINTIELRINAKKGTGFDIADRIMDHFSGGQIVTDFIQVENFEYDTIKVEIDVNGKKKTIDLLNPENLISTINFDEEIEIGSDGHPVFDEIDRMANEILDNIYDSNH